MTTAFSGERAYAHLEALCEKIGPRHGGSSGEAKAARYIRDHFKELGLRTRLERYPIYSFEDAHATLTTPRGKQIPCVPLPMTASTSARGITAPCLFIEGSEAVDLDDRVRGKIVVMFGSFRNSVQEQFHAFKPLGLVAIQTAPYRQHQRYAYGADARRSRGSIPTVILTLEDGIQLIKRLPKTLTLKLKTEGEKLTHGYNVVADLKGSDPGDDVIAMCAHFDSVWGSAGAMDNGAGTAAMLEFARVYAQTGSPRNMRFLAFGGEEMGLWGAKAYVKKLKNEDESLKRNKDFERDGLKSKLDCTRFLVNLDMMGQLYGKSNAITLGHADIAASARLLANELRYALAVEENSVYSSDNMAFNYAGVPSISFNRIGFESSGGHTSADTIDNCCAEGLAHIGGIVEAWMDRYVMSPHVFPFPRELPEAATDAVKKWFKEKNPLDYEAFTPQKRYRPKAKKGKK
ncbi:MAG: M28 family peptidase [Verrucomicrobia bacterium]|jgi:aminopeptidase YwaD|nr:M28 family peptidase [Verrucomicrobiota bacterium]